MAPRFAAAWAIVLGLALAACASPRSTASATATEGGPPHWQGRLAVKVYRQPPQAFAASFDLQGSAQQGSLLLSSPLGTTLAELHWNAGQAAMRTNSGEQHFDSLEALAREATGADIPVATLFAWLQGQPATAPHWEADLGELDNGRLEAHSTGQEPASVMKIILDR